MSQLLRAREFILPIGVITSVLVILVPMPSWLMDLLLAGNITLSVIVLLTTVYVKTPLEFSVFPTLLLASTLGRLVLNVASTRLILTRAETAGIDAAGGVIRNFGEFVAGDQIVVGLILFIIIVVIQFVVITKGATRISEVAARFVLDSLPGKQMAIDADLNNNAIDEKTAQDRRQELSRQADFYGAMDGASKFVRGDAIAGIIITFINIFGGLFIGVVQMGRSISEAASMFTMLSIGDGLVSQVPAFLISLSAALLTTRSTHESDLPVEFLRQIFSRPAAMAVAGGFLGILVMTKLPKAPLMCLGAGCVGISVMLYRRDSATDVAENTDEKEPAPKAEDRIEDYLTVDPMELELGVDLVRLADPNRGGDLLPRITGVRQIVASEIGIVLPKVRIRDNMELGERNYVIRIASNAIAQGEAHPDRLLAMEGAGVTNKAAGIETRDPLYHQPALWIEPGLRSHAEMLGYSPVVEPAAVLATHLKAVVQKHADELLTRDATRQLLDELKNTSPAAVEELIPGVMKLGEVQQVLQMLLREQVPIRQLGIILEALGDFASRSKEPTWLTECVRSRLARTICSQHVGPDGCLRVITLDPAVEDMVAAGLEQNERGVFVKMSPQAVQALCEKIAAETGKLTRQGHDPIVLVSPQIRAGLKQMTNSAMSRLVVLSYNETPRDTKIESVGAVNP